MIGGSVFGSTASRTMPATSLRERLGGHDALSFLAVIATFASMLALFAVSPIALEARGIVYIDSGGGLLAKVHPATLLAMLAFALRCLASRRPLHISWRLMTGDPGVLLLLASVVVAAIFAALVDKTPVSPLVDTFILPVLVFVLLRDLDRRTAIWLAGLVALVLVVNAGMAIVELLRGFHFVQVTPPPEATDDPTQANALFSWKADMAHDWRAEALLGHPLVNGLVVGSLVLCLASPGAVWIPFVPRILLLGVQAMSLFAFGARTALVLSFVFAAWLLSIQVAEAIRRGARPSSRMFACAMLVMAAVVAVTALLVYDGFADKTLDRFSHDSGSASTRLTMFTLLTQLSWADLFLHPDKDLVATLQRIHGLEFGIESSWIGLVLSYGIIIAAVITAGVLAFWRSVLRFAGRGGSTVFLLYFILISVTASLSGKTTTMAMVVALIVLFLRKDAVTASALRRNGSE